MAIIIGLFVGNVENFGLLGTNTMESSCHYSQVSYLSTIWEGIPCAFTLETLVILWLCIMVFPVVGAMFSCKIKKGECRTENIKLIKWLTVFSVILFISVWQYWRNELLTIVTFYKLILGVFVFLSPFLIFDLICWVFFSKKQS
jgi:hypothetical protein